MSGWAEGPGGGLLARAIADAFGRAADADALHGMVPGSHERLGGPECRCGATWDRWNDRCTTAAETTP